MTMLGSVPGARHAFALGLDMSSVVREVKTAAEARGLPAGSIVGDQHGGLTFTDDVAAVLESRSLSGWQEIEPAPGENWTIIVLNR